MILNFDDYRSHLYNERYSILEQYIGIDTVMSKIVTYQKRELACINSSLDENYSQMTHKNPDIYFNAEEREGVKNLFKEFIPLVVESMFNELTEAGVEFDESILNELDIKQELNESFKERFSKAFNSVSNAAQKISNKVGGAISDTKEYLKDAGEKIKDAAKDVKDKIVEKYKNIIEFLTKIVDIGAKTVKEFITGVAKLFSKLADTIKEALKKLGAFKEDSAEIAANINIDEKLIEGMYDDQGEKNFLSHVMAYVAIMMSNEKKKVDEILSEGLENVVFDFDTESMNEANLMDKIANNKFMQFILQYGKDKKISIWKSALISLVGIIVISFGLPVILSICGVGAAATATICGAVRIIWSARGAVRVILNRYVNKRPGERLFDTKTCLLLALCILPQISPFRDWAEALFRNLMHWLHLDKWIENLEGKLGELIEKLHGRNPSIEEMSNTYDEVINHDSQIVQFQNVDQSNADMLGGMRNIGASESQLKGMDSLIHGSIGNKTSLAMHDDLLQAAQNAGPDLPHGWFFDSEKPGVNAAVFKALQQYGELNPNTVVGRFCNTVLRDKTNAFAGGVPSITNVPKSELSAIEGIYTANGGNWADVQIFEYGESIIQDTTTHTDIIRKPVHWLFDTLTKAFSPIFIPFFDKKQFGKYKLRFASGTRGAAAYVVDRVEGVDSNRIDSIGKSNALDTLKNLHKTTWDDVKKNHDNILEPEKPVEESKKPKEEEEKKENVLKEPKYIVFYVRPNDDTKHESDKPTEGGEVKESGDSFAGMVMDPLTMMCADVCDFNDSTRKRRRKNPYFIKGLFSKLSFKPLDKNDNDIKDYIRQTLGMAVNTFVNICVQYGKGKEYIDITENKEEKKLEYSLKDGVEGDKEMPEIGNFTPNEILTCIKDKSETHKEAYKFLDGTYGSKVSIKKNRKDGTLTLSSRKDEDTIENVRYIKATKEEKKEAEDKAKNWAFTMNGKKPSVPKYIELPDGTIYRKATKQDREEHDEKDFADWVDIKILPLLTVGEKRGKKMDTSLKDELQKDDIIKKVLYKSDDELNEKTIKVIKEFLYRPEKSFSRDDEHDLKKKLEAEGVEGHKLSFWKNLIKDEEQLHDTIKRIVEIIWDYILEDRRSTWKNKDNKFNTGKTPKDDKESDTDKKAQKESYEEYTLFDQLIEESLLEDDDYEEEEAVPILEQKSEVLSFEDYCKQL